MNRKVFPKYNPGLNEMWQVDVRSADLSSFDLSNNLNDLIHASFDSKTVWPEKLPADYKPDVIMETGKDPGLGIRELHRRGITGKGIGIAIIDMGLFAGHYEYKDQLRLYEEIQCIEESSMHGSAVSSIAVGKTVGVAPEADLYYIGTTPGTAITDGFILDLSFTARSIDRICEINKTLPPGRKIRVISISNGMEPSQLNYDMVLDAAERARKENIYIIDVDNTFICLWGKSLACGQCTDSRILNGKGNITYYGFIGMGREPLSDPNDLNSYGPGLYWKPYLLNDPSSFSHLLMLPMDCRSTASPTGSSDYVFYPDAGMSWAVPYLAGLYALTCQVNGEMTPDVFWKIALVTGKETSYHKDGKRYRLGKIVNPRELVLKSGRLKTKKPDIHGI